MYAKLELIKRATILGKEPDKNLKLARSRYEIQHDRLVRFVLLLKVGRYVYFGRQALLCLAVKRSAMKAYSKLLPPRKEQKK